VSDVDNRVVAETAEAREAWLAPPEWVNLPEYVNKRETAEARNH
jgi:hypothetical protein